MFTLLFYKIQKKPHEKSEVCMVTQGGFEPPTLRAEI